MCIIVRVMSQLVTLDAEQLRFHDFLHQRSVLKEVGVKSDRAPQYKLYGMYKQYVDIKGKCVSHGTKEQQVVFCKEVVSSWCKRKQELGLFCRGCRDESGNKLS